MGSEASNFRLEVRPTVRARSPRELLVFSLDDTLVDTSLYWLVRAALSRAVAAKTGKKDERIEKSYEAWGATSRFGAEEVGVGLEETWLEFQKDLGVTGKSDQDLYMLMASLLRRKYPSPVRGAEDLLKWAQSRFTVTLLISGEAGVEQQKLEDAKLAGYFKVVKVVPAKGTDDFLALFSELGFSPRNCWVIGSSVESDISPAIAAGANCIVFTPRKRDGSQGSGEETGGTGYRVHELVDAMSILAK
jgi:putative hydrolase of the HAD superfamily